jgi:hypothetical protein
LLYWLCKTFFLALLAVQNLLLALLDVTKTYFFGGVEQCFLLIKTYLLDRALLKPSFWLHRTFLLNV